MFATLYQAHGGFAQFREGAAARLHSVQPGTGFNGDLRGELPAMTGPPIERARPIRKQKRRYQD